MFIINDFDKDTSSCTTVNNILGMFVTFSLSVLSVYPGHWPNGLSVHQCPGRLESNPRSSYTKDSKDLMLPCLTLSYIRYGSRVKWINPRKGEAFFPIPRCSSYWNICNNVFVCFFMTEIKWYFRHLFNTSLPLHLYLILNDIITFSFCLFSNKII